MQSSWEPDFFVADWRVRPALGQLERGDVAVSIEARSLQVLACLARHAPDVVSKQRLIREVWGEAFVSDEVLSHAIWELRKAFGDEARKPRFIQTIPKKGYRLLAEVSSLPDPEPPPPPPDGRINQYEILAPLGGGAMGEVFKARDLRLGRVVALKFLSAELVRDPSARQRFLREAQAVALIDHPNVATIYEVGKTESGRAFLALAFYEGETLQQKLERGPLPLAEAVGIARQIAQGLAAAHRRQIVHRDVKPSNIVILPDGLVKLLDFGLAKMAGMTTVTRLGSSPGTPAYKSPEQTRGEKVDPRSDLWALGVVLYEMVAGRVPFGGEYEQAVIYSILNSPPRPLDPQGNYPPELWSVIERALAKDPAARYGTAEEMEKDLARIALTLGGEVEPPRPTAAPPRRLPLRKRWLAAALVILVALGSYGVWQSRESRWDFAPEVERLMEQGEILQWQGDTERILSDAEKTYSEALKLDPENPLIQAELAALLARLDDQFPAPGRRREIDRLTASAVERAPDHVMPWVARAKFLLLENRPKDAELAALEAIKQDPEFDRGYTQLGEALIAQDRLDDGLKEIRRAIDLEKGHLRARLAYGIKLKDASYYDDAVIEFRKVLYYAPGHPTAQENLGAIYLITGRYLEAIPLFRAVFEKTRDWRSANSLGIAYFNVEGRMTDAIRAFGEAYELSRSPTAARNLAESYEKVGQKAEAHKWYSSTLESLDRTLTQNGPNAEVLNIRAFCAAKLGRFDEAMRNVGAARKLKPKKNSFLFRAAQICAMAGRRVEVYSYTRQAIEAGYSREDFRRDLAFQDFQDDSRFRAILESAVP